MLSSLDIRPLFKQRISCISRELTCSIFLNSGCWYHCFLSYGVKSFLRSGISAMYFERLTFSILGKTEVTVAQKHYILIRIRCWPLYSVHQLKLFGKNCCYLMPDASKRVSDVHHLWNWLLFIVFFCFILNCWSVTLFDVSWWLQ